MSKIVPLKKYGQNFLIDKNIIGKIIAEINPQKDDTIIEIGPGQGALTQHLLNKCDNFFAVEIDGRAIEKLQSEMDSLKIIKGDFLKLDLTEFATEKQKIRIAGNIPYNITKPIVLKLIENRSIINDAVLMVQYEVAKKLTAEISDDEYGILSVLMKYFTSTEICFKVSPGVFFPKPKVSSAVVHISFKPESGLEQNFDNNLFIKVVNAAFGKRRKTLKNSLSNSIFRQYNFSNSGVDLTRRAEEISINDFVKLTRAVIEQRKN